MQPGDQQRYRQKSGHLQMEVSNIYLYDGVGQIQDGKVKTIHGNIRFELLMVFM